MWKHKGSGIAKEILKDKIEILWLPYFRQKEITQCRTDTGMDKPVSWKATFRNRDACMWSIL